MSRNGKPIRLYDKDGNEITGDDLRIDPSKLNLPSFDKKKFFKGKKRVTLRFDAMEEIKPPVIQCPFGQSKN